MKKCSFSLSPSFREEIEPTNFNKRNETSKELLGECKSRAGGFKLIYDAKEQDDADILFIKQDRKPVLVVMSLEDYIKGDF